jgi:RNA polymerase sigma factor (sigma-70 family)
VREARPEERASSDHRAHRARFRTVFDANYHHVLGYALRRTGSKEDAEDVVAETFLTAWRRLDRLPEGAGVRPWLYGIARKVLANQRRGDVRRARLNGRVSSFAAQQPSDVPDEVAAVAAAFAQLSDDDREVLALTAWEELHAGEIATVLGCSRNAARIRLHRARRRLAHELEVGREREWNVRRAEAR